MIANKFIHQTCAIAALQGVLAGHSHDDRGRHTIPLTSDVCTRGVVPEELSAPLKDCRGHRSPGTFVWG